MPPIGSSTRSHLRLLRQNASGPGGPPLPPADRANLVWAWDPDQPAGYESALGPVGTLQTPVKTVGPPGYFTFGATDQIVFGDALDPVWTAGAWTIYTAIDATSADIAATYSYIVNKYTDATNAEFDYGLNSGKPQVVVYHLGSTSNSTHAGTNAAISAGRHVLAVSYDPAQPRTVARFLIFVDGTTQATDFGTAGSDGAIADTTATLAVGGRPGSSYAPVSRIGAVYAYRGWHSLATVQENTTWFQNVKGWV